MREEYVLTEWQLSALDSFQWKSLGAPIGLAVAVHQIIQQEHRQQQQPLCAFPSDNQTTQESKILHDLDQHNHIMESAIFDIHNNSMDEKETEAPVSSSTVVDAAARETPAITDANASEPHVDEISQDSEVIETESLEGDTALKAEDDSTELLASTNTESSIPGNDPDEQDEAKNVAPENTSSIEESVITDHSPLQEPEEEHVSVTSIDVDSNIFSGIKNDGDNNVNVVQKSVDQVKSSVDKNSPPPVDKSIKPDSSVTSEDAISVSLDKTSLEESSSWNAEDEDLDTVPTRSMSEESVDDINDYYNKPALSPSLSAPLPHDDCADSFHVSQSKALLVKPSFDSEDISEDPEFVGGGRTAVDNSTEQENGRGHKDSQSIGGIDTTIDSAEKEKVKGTDNNRDSLPKIFQKEESQGLDSFVDSEDMDEEESLDHEDDILISGQDLLVDLSGDPQVEASKPSEFSFGQFRIPLVDPNSVTITEFRTGSDLDEDGHDEETGESSTTRSISEPYSMHKRATSSLESLYYVDGDACTVVASNLSPERRNRPKRRRSLEDSTSHTIHTFSHVSSFDVEWDEFCLILGTVPSKTRRTILSQLLIMTNGRTKAARYKMAKQVSQMILKSAPREEDSTKRKQRNSQLRSNLQLFAKLHREERKALGKRIFEQISKLYVGGDNDDKMSKETTKTTTTPADNDTALEQETSFDYHSPAKDEEVEQL